MLYCQHLESNKCSFWKHKMTEKKLKIVKQNFYSYVNNLAQNYKIKFNYRDI